MGLVSWQHTSRSVTFAKCTAHNTYNAEGALKSTDHNDERLKKLRTEFMYLKVLLQGLSNASTVAEKVGDC
jgi:hypothetical protein